ncbi:MAG: TolC family protein [Dysgonamonadaceae bacterium]|nr:TolC family protein [Dysgonamonadaceae bacterium]
MNKNLKIILLALMATSFLGVEARAQQSDTLTLNLQSAIDIALSESPTVKVANKEIERVDYSKKSAWYSVFPSLEASGQFSKYYVPAKMSMMGQVMDSPADFNAQGSLQLSLPLFAPALWHTISMSELDIQLAVEKAHASKITLCNDVTKAYYNVLLAQDSYLALKSGYALAEEVYNQAQKRFELGLAAQYDAISAEVQMKNLQPNLLEVENGIEQAKMLLKVLIGLDVALPLKITGNLSDFENEIIERNSLQVLSADNNTDLRQMDIQKKQLEKGLQLQFSQRLPTLAAFGTYGYAGTGNKETTMNFGEMPILVEKSKEWFSQGLLVGVQLNVPLTGIFTNTAKEKQIKIQLQQLDLQRDYLKNSIDVQLRTAQNNMDKAAKQSEAAKKNVQLSQKGYDIAAKRYENGMGTVIELQNASLALTQAYLAYNQAIATYLTAKSDLDKLLGKEK